MKHKAAFSSNPPETLSGAATMLLLKHAGTRKKCYKKKNIKSNRTMPEDNKSYEAKLLIGRAGTY